MKGFVLKEALLTNKKPHRWAYNLRVFNVWVPCEVITSKKVENQIQDGNNNILVRISFNKPSNHLECIVPKTAIKIAHKKLHAWIPLELYVEFNNMLRRIYTYKPVC